MDRGVREILRSNRRRGGTEEQVAQRLLPDVLRLLQAPMSDPLQTDAQSATSKSLWQLILAASPPLSTSPKGGTAGRESDVPGSDPLRYRLQVYMGPAFSGAPYHSHGPAFNLLLHTESVDPANSIATEVDVTGSSAGAGSGGSAASSSVQGGKLWFLLPPANDAYSSVHPLLAHLTAPTQTTKEDAKGRKTADDVEGACMLRQPLHSLLFVPRHVSHRVLNLQESAGFALEVEDYRY